MTAFARDTFAELYEQLKDLDSRIERVTHRMECVCRAHPVCQKLAAVPGIGPMTATALVATVGRPQRIPPALGPLLRFELRGIAIAA